MAMINVDAISNLDIGHDVDWCDEYTEGCECIDCSMTAEIRKDILADIHEEQRQLDIKALGLVQLGLPKQDHLQQYPF